MGNLFSWEQSSLETRRKQDIVTERRTTDVLFFLAIIAMWVAMTFIGRKSFSTGDPFRLVAGVDDLGRVCGYDEGIKAFCTLRNSRHNSVVCFGRCKGIALLLSCH
jgi:hypothetical protein